MNKKTLPSFFLSSVLFFSMNCEACFASSATGAIDSGNRAVKAAQESALKAYKNEQNRSKKNLIRWEDGPSGPDSAVNTNFSPKKHTDDQTDRTNAE
jgi:hypothetical protein